MRLPLCSLLLLAGCANSDKANDYAREWLHTYRGDWTITAGPNCEHSDSDGNGRVRCNVTIERAGVTENPAIECPSGWLWQPFTTECQSVKN